MGVKNGGMKKKTNSSTRGNEALSRRSLFKGATAGIIGGGLAGCTGKFAINAGMQKQATVVDGVVVEVEFV